MFSYEVDGWVGIEILNISVIGDIWNGVFIVFDND